MEEEYLNSLDSSIFDSGEDEEPTTNRRITKIKVQSLIRRTSFSPLKERTNVMNSIVESDEKFNLLEFKDKEKEDDKEFSLEEIRRKNMEAINLLMNSFRDPELEKQFVSITPRSNFVSKPKKRKKDTDTGFRFRGLIPQEKRKSSRLQNRTPEYTGHYIDYIYETSSKTYFKGISTDPVDQSLEDLEKVVFQPKRKFTPRKKPDEHVIIPVEDVTKSMLDKIALRVKGKVYSQEGTTCHQCRQKTLDQKTCCRNPGCVGIQGMFCGVCIKNRYGEDAAEALLDPTWQCPVCRGICNCSICRAKQGKRPTGVLAPYAQAQGFDSVKEFLGNLSGFGDNIERDIRRKLELDGQALLGFSGNGRRIHLSNGSADLVVCQVCSIKMNLNGLLGFSSDGRSAVMGGYRYETLII